MTKQANIKYFGSNYLGWCEMSTKEECIEAVERTTGKPIERLFELENWPSAYGINNYAPECTNCDGVAIKPKRVGI